MKRGKCQLCGGVADLVESHVWPRFGYKRYVSELSKGGSFVDLGRMELSNRQYKRYWFCEQCDNERLSGAETYGSLFCSALESNQTGPQPYDERLLRFVTSLSLRTLMFDIDRGKVQPDVKMRAAMRQWKRFLVGKQSQVKPFSQHLFLVFAHNTGLHKAMGGEVFPAKGLVLSQFGPLFVAGLFDRGNLPLKDLRAWGESEVLPGGGVIHPVSAWRVGKNITLPFAQLLAKHERRIIERVLSAGKEL